MSWIVKQVNMTVCVQQDRQPTKAVFWSMVLDVPDDGGGRQQCSLPAR
jgi:hypothetical protein